MNPEKLGISVFLCMTVNVCISYIMPYSFPASCLICLDAKHCGGMKTSHFPCSLLLFQTKQNWRIQLWALMNGAQSLVTLLWVILWPWVVRQQHFLRHFRQDGHVGAVVKSNGHCKKEWIVLNSWCGFVEQFPEIQPLQFTQIVKTVNDVGHMLFVPVCTEWSACNNHNNIWERQI